MIVESFLECFVQFYFLTQTDDFAKAIAHGQEIIKVRE